LFILCWKIVVVHIWFKLLKFLFLYLLLKNNVLNGNATVS